LADEPIPNDFKDILSWKRFGRRAISESILKNQHFPKTQKLGSLWVDVYHYILDAVWQTSQFQVVFKKLFHLQMIHLWSCVQEKLCKRSEMDERHDSKMTSFASCAKLSI